MTSKPHHLPILAICNSMRSGGNLINRLLDGHNNLVTNHSETFFGIFSDISEKSVHIINHFNMEFISNDADIFFDYLLKNDNYHLHASNKGWVKTNYKNPIKYSYSIKKHKLFFKKFFNRYKTSSVRDVYDYYISSFFLSFENIDLKNKIFFNTYWPNFFLFKKNINNFFQIYQDGYILYVIRDPLQWAASCKVRRPNQFNYNYMNNIYNKSNINAIYAKKKFKHKIIIIGFNELLRNHKSVINKIYSLLDLEKIKTKNIYPTFFGKKIIGNSVFENERTNHVNINVTKKYHSVLSKEEIFKIDDKFRKNFDILNDLKI